MISKELREFIDDIDDQVVKAQLTALVSKVDLIEDGHKGLNASHRAEAYDRMVAGYDQAIRNQKASINRLLDERRKLMDDNAYLSKAVALLQVDPAKVVGPE